MDAKSIQSFLRSYNPASIPEQHRGITCACADAEANQRTLGALEEELRTAAQLGKALLNRHEDYTASSERERKAMVVQIETLTTEKDELEKQNATTIRENCSLLDQLEGLNGVVADADTEIHHLQSTLQSTQHELQKLASLAARTERLEQQLADFERDQATWQSTLEEKDQSTKAVTRRWQDAQRTLAGVQDEIERIEREAREEKERHVEVLGRMERRHAVERELNSAAGRLKGAAALRTAGKDATGTNVVSHFVKDILQDNANLQMGIVELRDMLQTSNEEVESLRTQLTIHGVVNDPDAPVEVSPSRPHLKEEMRRATAQELHVHHHYHASPPSAAQSGTLRRPKKKRPSALTAGHFTITPVSGRSTPRSSFSYGTPGSAATILQHTAASLPGNALAIQRWSRQSDQSYPSIQASSGPGSPHSTHRTSSLFDRVFSDAGQESSRPTTPETEEPGSPTFLHRHSKRPSLSSARSHSAVPHRTRPSLDSILDMSIENLRQLDQQTTAPAIPEENEHDWENSSSPPAEDYSSTTSPFSDEPSYLQAFNARPLRRAASHESLLSIAGRDVHTIKTRPSQLFGSCGGRGYTTQAVLSDATAMAACPAVMSRPSNSGRSILSGMAAEQRQQTGRQGLGKKVGGWMFGRWGTTPTPTPTVPAESTTASRDRTASIASGSDSKSIDDLQTMPKKPKLRPPGINQSGPIPGFPPELRRQHEPIVNRLDQEALKKLLRHE